MNPHVIVVPHGRSLEEVRRLLDVDHLVSTLELPPPPALEALRRSLDDIPIVELQALRVQAPLIADELRRTVDQYMDDHPIDDIASLAERIQTETLGHVGLGDFDLRVGLQVKLPQYTLKVLSIGASWVVVKAKDGSGSKRLTVPLAEFERLLNGLREKAQANRAGGPVYDVTERDEQSPRTRKA